MKARFKLEKKINVGFLLKKLKEISEIQPDGRVSYDAFEIERIRWIFLSLLDFNSTLTMESKEIILNRTFSEIVLKENFNEDKFLSILHDKIKLYNQQPENEFYLLTSLSVKELPFRKIQIDKCKIIVAGKRFPKKYLINRSKVHEEIYHKKEKNDYLKIIAIIKSRGIKEAYEEAYKFIEVFRGMLCLLLNNYTEIQIGNPSLEPINKVRLGEFSSLHRQDGTLADPTLYWYEPYFQKAKVLGFEKEQKGRHAKNLRWLINRYNKCNDKHRSTLSKVLNLYVSAYDESIKYVCFLRAWTALETLLNSDQNDIIIKRCSSLYLKENQIYQKQILEGLRTFRNEFVHEGFIGLDPFNACFIIQSYIFDLVHYNLRNAGFFANIDEANTFRDNLDKDIVELKSKKKLIDKAIFHKVKKSKS